MVRGILNIFKCSSFSPFSICRFCFSLCPSIYGADFERMITSRCLCAICSNCKCYIFRLLEDDEYLPKNLKRNSAGCYVKALDLLKTVF